MPEEDYTESAEVVLEAVEDEAREADSVHLPNWAHWATLSTMIMALFSAAGGLLAGKTANEALIDRQKEIHQVIGANHAVLETEMVRTHITVLESMGRLPPPPLLDRLRELEEAAERDTEKILADLEQSQAALEHHEIFAVATTLLSVAISLTGMSVIVRRRGLWYSGLVIASAGAVLLFYGLGTS